MGHGDRRARGVRGTWLLAAILTGCTGYRPAPPAFHAALEQPYRVGPGDRLRITVFDQATLTNTYSVDQSGSIAFPLIGAVAAHGRSAPELEGMIAASCGKAFCAIPTSRSRSTAIARCSSWARSARPDNTRSCRE